MEKRERRNKKIEWDDLIYYVGCRKYASQIIDDMGCFMRKPVDADDLIKHNEAELL